MISPSPPVSFNIATHAQSSASPAERRVEPGDARLQTTATSATDADPRTANAKNPNTTLTDVKEATELVKDFLKPINSNLQFSIDDESGKVVVKMIDPENKEVIRQIPSEEMLAIAKTLDTVKGLFLQQRA